MIAASPRCSGASSKCDRKSNNRDSVSTTTSTLTLGGTESLQGINEINKMYIVLVFPTLLVA